MNDDFSEFENMKSKGADANQAYLRSKQLGLDPFAQIRMLRAVFGLTLEQAKEVTVTAGGGSSSLSEHQEKLLPSLKKAIEDS